MIGLLYLAFFCAYLLISVLFIYVSVKFAKKIGFNPWLPGITVAVAMYMVVFWDFIPVLIKHNNLCKEQGGFWIYKTPEQWFKENPDALKMKRTNQRLRLKSEIVSGWNRDWQSAYIYDESHFERHYDHAISKYEYRMIDAKTGQILARMVDFERGGGNPMLHADGITDYKFWLGLGDNKCNSAERSIFIRKVNNMIEKFNVDKGAN